MIISTQGQWQAFLAMALCGLGMGVLHDLMWPLRRRAFAAAAADLALGILSAAGVIAMALYLGCEAFRLYTLLGVMLGWAIYAMTLGMIVRILRRKFIKLPEKVTN